MLSNLDWFSDFQELKQSNSYSIDKIEWWLLKFSCRQQEAQNYVYGQNKNDLIDGIKPSLPSFIKLSENESFLDLYNSLNTLCDLHRNEKYFEQELISYQKIKNSIFDLKKWVSKNEDLGANKYVCFFLDYLDYDADEKVENLNVFVHSIKELEIFVNREDFKFTIEFLKIFNELYWVQEIIPKSVEKIKIDKTS